jgi:hypothetical protein
LIDDGMYICVRCMMVKQSYIIRRGHWHKGVVRVASARRSSRCMEGRGKRGGGGGTLREKSHVWHLVRPMPC